jgi:hypothetical protein
LMVLHSLNHATSPRFYFLMTLLLLDCILIVS